MQWKEFVNRVTARAGGGREDDVLAAVEQLAHFIPEFDAQLLGTELPTEVRDVLSDDANLVNRKARRTAPPDMSAERGEGAALELYMATCQVIDDALQPEVRDRFRRNLSDELVATFERSAGSSRTHGPKEGHTLADGRAGSSSPLSEASPAQRESIANRDDPRTDSKISGARGLTQEREGRNLSVGEPGSTRPISDTET